MAVHLTRIYTKTGDDGTTALGDMSRARKTDPRLAAYADVDEANSAIGVALALGGLSEEIRELLTGVQNDLSGARALPEPALRPAVHPRPLREPGGRRALAAGRQPARHRVAGQLAAGQLAAGQLAAGQLAAGQLAA